MSFLTDNVVPHKDHPHAHVGPKTSVPNAITGCLSIDLGKNDASATVSKATHVEAKAKANEPSIQKVQKHIIKPNSVPHKSDAHANPSSRTFGSNNDVQMSGKMAVLRSKTANFERHFRAKTDEPKKVTTSTTSEPIVLTPKIVDATMAIAAAVKSQSESAINVIKQGPVVYKRQEIISSIQRPTDKKK
jgi:hypothetical protein